MPIIRPPAAMHDCNDEDVIGFYGIKHRIWKNMDKASPHVLFEEAPACRSLGNLPKRRFNTCDESNLKTGLNPGVVTRRSLILVESLRMKLIPHRATARRTRARPSSHGMVLTRPLRTSSRRRRASAAQSCRIWPSSAGSRLSTKRSARSARASLGRERASSAICSTVMRMRGL